MEDNNWKNIVLELADTAADSDISFAQFVNYTEDLALNLLDHDNLQKYRDAWIEMELINASSLAEWEENGSPDDWKEQWNNRFRKDAEKTLVDFLVIFKTLLFH